MDFATIIGIIGGIFLLGGAVVLQGEYYIFASVESLMIVLGGTMAGTLIKYSFGELLKIPHLIKISLNDDGLDSAEMIDIMVKFAEKARREGLLALEQNAQEVDNTFLQEGIQLVVDGTDPELVRNILETKLTFIEDRHSKGQSIFSTMGKLAPSFGMIGTLIGLVHMLSQLDDPDELGSGMAVALITTLYGALMANLFFIPLAGKLKRRSENEVLLKEVMIEGILSIQAGENPRIVEEKLKAFLRKKDESEDYSKEESELEARTVRENV